MSTKYVGIILTYPAPNPPEFYLIPESAIDDRLHEALVEQSGDFPRWSTEEDEVFYDLNKAEVFEMSPHKDELTYSPKLITRWYGYVVN